MPDIEINEPITITIEDEVPNQPIGSTVIETAPDPVPAPAPDPVPAPAENKISTDPEEGIELLRQQLARRDTELLQEREARRHSEAARVEAERAARDHAGKAEQFRAQASDASYDSVVNAIGAASAELESATARQVDAYEKGDFSAVAKLNGEIGRISARIEGLETGKVQMDQRRQAPNQAQPVQQFQETAEQVNRRPWSQHEFDRYIGTRTPRSAQWVRSHPEFAADPLFRTRVIGADGYVADTLGIPRDTDEYFRRVEEALNLGTASSAVSQAGQMSSRDSGDLQQQQAVVAQQLAAQQSVAAAQRQRAAVPAAPPSRSVPTSRGNMSGTQITLSEEERKTAHLIMPPKIKDTDPDPEVLYAKHKIDMIRQGLMTADGKLTPR